MSRFDLEYFSFADYSPRGKSDASLKSQSLVKAIKRASPKALDTLADAICKLDNAESIRLHLHGKILVPIPRSSPNVAGAIWPTLEICNALVSSGLAKEVDQALQRAKAVSKSAFSKPEDRPTAAVHQKSIKCTYDFFGPEEIVLVDDVLTKGSTFAGCASSIIANSPSTKVSLFSIFRTMGFVEDIGTVVNPGRGIVKLFPSGKVFRDP